MNALKPIVISMCLSAGAASAAESGVTAQEALDQMSNAMQTLNYQGTVAFFRNNKLETMRYFHAAKDGQQQERLLSLNSPMREVVRESGSVRCRFNDKRPIVVDHRPYENSFLVDLPSNLERVAGVYRIELNGEEEVAMLPSYVVEVRPNDDFRYSRKLWVDKQSFLPLKVAIYDQNGATLEQIVFTEQKVTGPLSFVRFDSAEPVATQALAEQVPSHTPDQAPFTVSPLPPGFEPIYYTRRHMPGHDQPVDHLVLSDGFALVSVYLDNAKQAVETGLQSAGALSTYTRNLNDHLITVMGEVPATTVKMIAEHTRLNAPVPTGSVATVVGTPAP